MSSFKKPSVIKVFDFQVGSNPQINVDRSSLTSKRGWETLLAPSTIPASCKGERVVERTLRKGKFQEEQSSLESVCPDALH